MEHQKIINLLNEANDSKFATKKWNIFNDQSNENYDAGNEIICHTEVLKSNRCDYNDTYILVRDNITIIWYQTIRLIFKNCLKLITKIDGTTIIHAEDVDLVMAMYSMIAYSSNNSKAASNFCFHSKDEATNFKADTVNGNADQTFGDHLKCHWLIAKFS